ncbi:hypothetical protein KGA66_27550 [Actinocrinis puniceicyclus]|uniref:HTH cro/C1-type domain-containing protein n=1 Tax=Actinocrinis puniceicyclus TaxID=977794 RepID=A0A8J7WQS8_9ACTN|nr:hypothetical protein [Actinocrinis puniceicyclus]MBS2966821.1 hypothetical protein [Actinocrinis puniceicyclus]
MSVPIERRLPNHALRALRQSLHMSQSEFARAVQHAGQALGEPNTCNKRLIQKWESGEHTDCRPNYRRALERVTRAPYDRLGFLNAGSVQPAPTPWRALAAIESLHGGRGQPVPAAYDRLRHAFEKPVRADAGSVELIEAATDRFFDREHHQRASVLQSALTRHIDAIAALLTGTSRDALRRRLTLAGGKSAALAGWLAFDQADTEGAHRWWDSALAAARTTGDGALFACALTYLSHSAAERGDPATAWQLAHTAAAHAGADPRTRAWTTGRAAQEAAQFGEAPTALNELNRAVKLGGELPPSTPGDGTPPWARFVDAAYIWAVAANVHGHLGNTIEAHTAATRAIAALAAGQTKIRALILAEAAYATAAVGEMDFAMNYASEAATLAETLESTPARRRLRALIPLLPRPLNAPARELVQHITID